MTLEATITKLMWLMALPETDYESMREKFFTKINHDILFSKRIEAEKAFK